MSLFLRHQSFKDPLRLAVVRSTRVPPHGKKRLVGIIAAVAVLVFGFVIGGLFANQKVRAQVETNELVSVPADLNRLLDEIDQISVDQIRKIVIKEITKKVIEKVIYGDNGGIGIGGALGSSGNGSGAFVQDYARFLYTAANEDTQRFIDVSYDKYFPNYINPEVKTLAKDRFDPNYNFVPNNCVDVRTIDFKNDPQALVKLDRAAQSGCNDQSALAILTGISSEKSQQIVEASKTEAIANKGVVSKDEKTNELKQSGIVYEGIVQGAIEAVYNVQTESQSAVSQIIGALVDQVIDEILSQTSD